MNSSGTENKKQRKHSKNERAGKLLGFRSKGMPILEPWEMGYSCPICHTRPIFDKEGNLRNELELLQFSEYNAFMWCPICNIDLPFAFCMSILMNPFELKLKQAIDNFLDFVEELKDGKIGICNQGEDIDDIE